MKLYTKGGDKGTTALIGGQRVAKSDARVEAYGTIDECVAFLGLLADQMRPESDLSGYVDDVVDVSRRLMSVEAIVAQGQGAANRISDLTESDVEWLEGKIDQLQSAVKPVDKFTIPGGHIVVSSCNVSRTVSRRAERAVSRVEGIYDDYPYATTFLNRLSDWLYVLGRRMTEYYAVDEVLWLP